MCTITPIRVPFRVLIALLYYLFTKSPDPPSIAGSRIPGLREGRHPGQGKNSRASSLCFLGTVFFFKLQNLRISSNVICVYGSKVVIVMQSYYLWSSYYCYQLLVATTNYHRACS